VIISDISFSLELIRICLRFDLHLPYICLPILQTSWRKQPRSLERRQRRESVKRKVRQIVHWRNNFDYAYRIWPTQEGLARPPESIRQTLKNVDSSLFRIFCSLFLKHLTDDADITCLSRLFHMLTILSETKYQCCIVSSLISIGVPLLSLCCPIFSVSLPAWPMFNFDTLQSSVPSQFVFNLGHLKYFNVM